MGYDLGKNIHTVTYREVYKNKKTGVCLTTETTGDYLAKRMGLFCFHCFLIGYFTIYKLL